MKIAALVFLSLFVSGCGGVVRRYAATELDCNRWSIDIDQIDSQTIRASGCGRRVIYRKKCQDANYGTTVVTSGNNGLRCNEWVLSR